MKHIGLLMADRLRVKVNMDNPCQEGWDLMQDVPSGRFCAKCQTTVVDMTSWSDTDLVEYFHKHPFKVCGRAHTNQLNRILGSGQQMIRPNYRFERALAVIIAFFSLQGKAEASGKGDMAIEAVSQAPATESPTDTVKITGRIVDLHSLPLPGVKVSFLDNIYFSDSSGRFEIRVSPGKLNNTVLTFEYDGLVREVRNYNLAMHSTDYQLQMLERTGYGGVTGGVMLPSYYLPGQYGINFVSVPGKSLDNQTRKTLASFAAILQSNPDFKILLQTHSHGNLRSALSKAFLVKNYLVEKLWIDEQRIVVPSPKPLEQKSDADKVYFLPDGNY